MLVTLKGQRVKKRRWHIERNVWTYWNSKWDCTTTHSCDDPTRVEHGDILSKADKQPSQNKWYNAQHYRTLATKLVNCPSTHGTSKNGSNCDQGLQIKRWHQELEKQGNDPCWWAAIKPFTPRVINMELLSIISIYYPANRYWENSNSSGSYLDLKLNSHNWFTRKYVAARGKN